MTRDEVIGMVAELIASYVSDIRPLVVTDNDHMVAQTILNRLDEISYDPQHIDSHRQKDSE